MPRHDDEKLRRFLAARNKGDDVGARRWWDELVTDNFDRVKSMVLLQSRGHLSPTEQEDALQNALLKLSKNMFLTFRGSSMGEWVESTRTLVFGVCVDIQRRAANISKHQTQLDRHDEVGDHTARYDARVYEAIEQTRREQEQAADDAEHLAGHQTFLDWAVPQLSPTLRAVIELDRQEVPVEEIQRRLGVSRDVVYKRRSRALKDLAKLYQEYES